MRKSSRQRVTRLNKWVGSPLRLVSAALKTMLAYLWAGVSGYRHLLGADAGMLTFRQRLQRAALAAYLALPDRFFCYGFSRFEKAVARLPKEKSPLPRSGIMLIIGTLGPGGAERQAVATMAGLAKRGYGPLRLACVSLREEWQRFYLTLLESLGLTAQELEGDCSRDYEQGYQIYMQAMKKAPPSLYGVADYARTLLMHRPQVAHFWLDECNIKGGMAAIAAGVPRIILGLRNVSPDNLALHRPYMREGYRWLARQPGVVLLNNSAAGAHSYENWLGLPKGVIRVVHNGFDFDHGMLDRYQAKRGKYRKQHSMPDAAPVVGTVIRLSDEKRPLLWLDIAAEVRRQLPDTHFLIVGDGPLRREVELRALHEDLMGFVHLAGNEQEVFAAIAAMDIFLLVSRAEGLPNVLIEAQALGVPVVTTKAGGASETVRHALTGWVLDQDGCRHVADVLVKLLRDEAWRSMVRNEAPAFVRDAFNAERMLDETLAIYGDDFDRQKPHEAGRASN